MKKRIGKSTDPDQIVAAYRIGEEKAIFLKYKSEESMLHALTFNSEDLTYHYADGKTAAVRMSHADEYIQYVRVYDLPPEVPDNEIALVLAKYGKVKSVVREKFPVELRFDAYTGVRGIYMDVKKEIPAALHFLSRKGNVFYPGNKDKCFVCRMEGHKMNSCPTRKARKESRKTNKGQGNQRKPETQAGSSTYAGVVAESKCMGSNDRAATAGPETVDETVEMLEEEVPEEEVAPTVADERNHPIYRIASHLAMEINRQKELRAKEEEEEEEAKVKSPPRKKKNCSLYRK